MAREQSGGQPQEVLLFQAFQDLADPVAAAAQPGRTAQFLAAGTETGPQRPHQVIQHPGFKFGQFIRDGEVQGRHRALLCV